jgi:peptide/nickel transport system ATP-binding protein
VVETGPAAQVAAQPQHPYTRMLFSAVLSPLDPQPANTIQPRGEPASPISPPSGCHFHPRCPHVMARCRTETPAARPAGESLVTCHLFEPATRASDAEVTAPDVLPVGKLGG